jgi:hypothetical protein
MYSKDTFSKLREYKFPDIYKIDFCKDYLILKDAKIHYDELIDKPAIEAVYTVEDKLYGLGLVDIDNNLTKLGEVAINLSRLPMESVRMIFTGYAYDVCVADLITIACIIEYAVVPTIIPICDQYISALLHFEVALFGNSTFDTGLSDTGVDMNFLKMLNIQSKLTEADISNILALRWDIISNMSKLGYSTYNVPSKINDLCQFLKEYTLSMQYTDNPIKIEEHPIYSHIVNMKKCIYEGYKMNLLVKKNNLYKTIRGDIISLPELYIKNDIDTYSRLGVENFYSPNILVAHEFKLAKNMKSGIYELSADVVSILDGFIGCNTNFFYEYTSDAEVGFTKEQVVFIQNSYPKGKLVYEPTIKKKGISGGMVDSLDQLDYGDDSSLCNYLTTRNVLSENTLA